MWYLTTILASLLIVVGVMGAVVLGGDERVTSDGTTVAGLRGKLLLSAAGVFVLWLIVSMFFIWHSVNAGHVGLVKAFGAYTSVKEEGLVTTFPWESIEEARIRNASHELRMDGGPNGAAASKESQEVFVVATINYSLEKGCVEDLYRNYGSGYYETIIEPRAKQIFKAESVRFAAVEILPNREKIRRETQAELSKQLDQYCVRGLDFLLTNVGFGPEFTAAIEDKQVATQQAAAEKNRVEIERQKARQVVIQAEADRIAFAKRTRSLSPLLVEYERIQKWQPEIIYLPSDTIVGLPNR